MTISLYIEFRDRMKPDHYIPVATQAIYSEYWRPIATELGLHYVLAIGNTGIPLNEDQERTNKLLHELERFKQVLLAQSLENTENVEFLVSRVASVLFELKIVIDNFSDIADAYIG